MPKLIKPIFYLSCLGTLFALVVTLRQYIAPASQPGIFSCVGFKIWGLSPCPYGLTLFALLFIISGLIISQRLVSSWAGCILRFLAWGGVIFSGWVGWREIGLPLMAKGGYFWETFSLATVPACVWGFFVFLAVAILTCFYKTKSA